MPLIFYGNGIIKKEKKTIKAFPKDLDKEFIPFMKPLNSYSIKTLYSCTGHKYAYLSFMSDVLTADEIILSLITPMEDKFPNIVCHINTFPETRFTFYFSNSKWKKQVGFLIKLLKLNKRRRND